MTPSPASVPSKSSNTGSLAASMTENALRLMVSPPSPASSPLAVEQALRASAAAAATAMSGVLKFFRMSRPFRSTSGVPLTI